MVSDVSLHSMNNFMIHLQNCRIKVELSEENSQEHTYFCSLISIEQAFEIEVQIRFFCIFLKKNLPQKVQQMKINVLNQMLEASKLLLISHWT